jgi:prolyl 4-hydroxylase
MARTTTPGKAKPAAKAPPAAQKKPAAKAAGMSRAALLGAVLAMGAGACSYLLLKGRGSLLPTVPSSARPTGGPPSETEEQRRRRLLQEGRGDPSMQRASCVDSWSGGCSSATAESCAGDPSVKSKCCNTCHKLTCVDTDPNCEAWAQSGECYKNTPFMLSACCRSCSPDHDDKCTHYPTERPDVAEGDINKIFERAVAEYPQYNPQVHSRDPWLVTFDNLLTDEETDGIFEAVRDRRLPI